MNTTTRALMVYERQSACAARLPRAPSLEQVDLGVVDAGPSRKVFLAHVRPASRPPQVAAQLLRDGHRPAPSPDRSLRAVSSKRGSEEISNSPRAAEKNRGR